MIHQALSKSEIAYRYYQEVAPDRNYPKEQARKQFQQDRNINVKVVRKILNDIFKEQLLLLKAINNA